MKIKNLINIIKDSAIWILLIFIVNIFFMILAWISYIEEFKRLIYIIILFSIGIISLAIFISYRKSTEEKNYIEELVKNPSEDNKLKAIYNTDEVNRDIINSIGNKLIENENELNRLKISIKEYEDFLEGWIHEIKTPISLMELVLENRKKDIPEDIYKKLNYSKLSIHNNVEKIMYYGRLNNNYYSFKYENINIDDCIEEILDELKGLIEINNIKIVKNIENKIIYSDEKSLRFIINQILLNSIKYSSNLNNGIIEIKSIEDEGKDSYYLEISDNGEGILKSDIHFIFEKGFVGQKGNNKKSTGIGLYIVKLLCDLMRIDIEVKSENEDGFQIRLYFPILDL